MRRLSVNFTIIIRTTNMIKGKFQMCVRDIELLIASKII